MSPALKRLLLAAGGFALLAALLGLGYEEYAYRSQLQQAAVRSSAVTPPSATLAADQAAAAASKSTTANAPALQATAADSQGDLNGPTIEIPAIDYHWVIQPDIENENLDRGPGHYPRTVFPGDPGNAAIAGHRTIRGRRGFFYRLNELQEGDPIYIHRDGQRLAFAVERVFVTDPTDLSVLSATAYPALTLTTCDPPGGDEKRLIVQARLVETP